MSVRVRFAPSPTGYLHIGGARTALFNWLYARHTGGTFVLRIEDTDEARNTQEAVDVILDGLRWLGLDWDEGPTSGDAKGPSKGGFGPYFQSQRGEIYKKRVAELIAKGAAYEKEGAIRFRMQREAVLIPDLVVGDVKRELTDREAVDPDFVIVRSDGQPVFHLVNVIDDMEMRITHVIRGEDHLSNTAKHIALFKAFGVAPPAYAHIPLILNPDGSKMSKRDTGASLRFYMDGGYVSDAVVNYLYLLGWSPKENREIMALADVIQRFDIPQILRNNAKFDINKMLWMNWEYVKSMPPEKFVQLGAAALTAKGFAMNKYSSDYISKALLTAKEKIKQFTDIHLFTAFYFVDEVEFSDEVKAKDLTAANALVLTSLRNAYSGLEAFDTKSLEVELKRLVAEQQVKAGVLVHPLRIATTGSNVGPSLYHLMEVLGKEKVLTRLTRAIALCA